MSKKITSLLTMLLLLFVCTGAMAQAPSLENKKITIGTAVSSIEADTWYLVYNGSRTDEAGKFLSAGESPGTGGYMTDMGEDKATCKLNVSNVTTGSLAINCAAYLVRFIDVSGGDESEVYQIQFATGNYLTGDLKTISNKYESGKFNFYTIDAESPGRFGFNKYNFTNLVNHNGTGGNLVYWKSGKLTSADYETLKAADTYNSVWHAISVSFTEVSDQEIALGELQAVIKQYDPYDNTFTTGTLPGQYDATAVQAFYDALAYAHTNAGVESSAEDLKKMAQDIKDTYAAVIASRVDLVLNGYYRIKTARTYTNNVVTGKDGDGKDITESRAVPKYMRTAVNGETITGRWGNVDEEDLKDVALALWKITQKDKYTYDIVNVASDARFTKIVGYGAITMGTEETDDYVVADIVANIVGTPYVNLRLASNPASDGYYIHQGGHNSGAGVAGNLVAWKSTYDNGTLDASEWQFVAVSDEDAKAAIDAYEPIKNHDLLLSQYRELLSEAKEKLELAKDRTFTKLITDLSQITFVQTDTGEGSEAAILDENPATYWHSDWHNPSTYGRPSLTIELAEPVQNFTWYIQRRAAVIGNHATKCNIYAGADKNNLQLIIPNQVIEKPGAYEKNPGPEVYTDIDLGAPYQVVKFEITEVNDNNRNTKNPDDETETYCYAHFAEFQMYTISANPNAQFNFMGELGTNLENVIEEQSEYEDADIDIDVYNTLKEAYDAFMTKYVDPTELRAVLKANKDVANAIVVGDNPGFWAEGSDAGSYATLYAEAEAYDAAGDYNPTQSQAYIEQLQDGASNIYASANPIQTGRWYSIRFASEEEFDNYGWDKSAGQGQKWDAPDLFDKYLCAAKYDANNHGGMAVTSADDLGLGDGLYFLDDNSIMDMDGTELFRFIPVGENGYMIQNKATGLFLKADNTWADIDTNDADNNVSLSVHPSLFTVRAVGYGENRILAKSITGESEADLHAQVYGNRLVVWNVSDEDKAYAGSRSGLYIEDIEPVEDDYDGTTYQDYVLPGAIGTYCFPVDVEAEEGMYDVVKVDGTTVTLCPIQKAIGGRPFVYIHGSIDEYDPEADWSYSAEPAQLKHGYEITATAPATHHLLKGTFKAETIGAGKLVASGNTFVTTKTSKAATGVNSAYIAEGEDYELENTYTTAIDITIEDGIQETLSKVAKSGAVYTIDGRLVSQKANLNDLSRFGKGIYILNGVKVVIK